MADYGGPRVQGWTFIPAEALAQCLHFPVGHPDVPAASPQDLPLSQLGYVGHLPYAQYYQNYYQQPAPPQYQGQPGQYYRNTHSYFEPPAQFPSQQPQPQPRYITPPSQNSKPEFNYGATQRQLYRGTPHMHPQHNTIPPTTAMEATRESEQQQVLAVVDRSLPEQEHYFEKHCERPFMSPPTPMEFDGELIPSPSSSPMDISSSPPTMFTTLSTEPSSQELSRDGVYELELPTLDSSPAIDKAGRESYDPGRQASVDCTNEAEKDDAATLVEDATAGQCSRIYVRNHLLDFIRDEGQGDHV